MRVKPLQDGSRSVEIDTAYLLLNATANTDGTVTVHACEVREPRKPSVTEDNIPSRGLGDTIEQSVAANHWGTGPARGVGDVFHDLVSAKYGLPACQRCKEIITEMNLLGVEGCKKTKAAILDGLWERKDQLKGWRGVIAKLPGTEALAKRELGKLFDAAVANNDPTATVTATVDESGLTAADVGGRRHVHIDTTTHKEALMPPESQNVDNLTL